MEAAFKDGFPTMHKYKQYVSCIYCKTQKITVAWLLREMYCLEEIMELLMFFAFVFSWWVEETRRRGCISDNQSTRHLHRIPIFYIAHSRTSSLVCTSNTRSITLPYKSFQPLGVKQRCYRGLSTPKQPNSLLNN